MKLLRSLGEEFAFKSGSVATIGNFDGVHRGHQELIHNLYVQAKKLQLPLVVVLFEPQPAEFFAGSKAPVRLSSLREKLYELRQLGVNYVYCLKFNAKLAEMAPEEFAEKYLFSGLNVRYLSVGADFRFGYQRTGTVDFLKKLADKTITIDIFSEFTLNQTRVSSTCIRQALLQDHLDKAEEWLGRPYSMCGRVIHGFARGRQWNVPTANIAILQRARPLRGVYCVEVRRQGMNNFYHGVANIGCRPTVDGQRQVLEIHLLDFANSLYGELLQVTFLHKLRDEIKFPCLDTLVAQIHKDVEKARVFFKEQLLIQCDEHLQSIS